MEHLIIENHSFTRPAIDSMPVQALNNQPVIYILYQNAQPKPTAYIGQSVQAVRRLQNHLSNPKRKGLHSILIYGHKTFNQSATYNIESNLINYFIADNKYMLQNVSQRASRQMHQYYQKSYYNETLFKEIWQHLRSMELVSSSLEYLENKDLFKISPFKELSPEQVDVKEKILAYCKENSKQTEHQVFIIQGDAGTGKSVLLSSLFNTIQDEAGDPGSTLYKTKNYLLVNHAEMLKTYKNMADSLPNLKKNNFDKPTSFINKMTKLDQTADITLVDEAHLLLTKEDSYNNFNAANHLQEIMKRSKITIIIFDPSQVLKIKSYWNEKIMQDISRQYKTKTLPLTSQLRMTADQSVVDWINAFLEKRVPAFPRNRPDDYEFQLFDDPDAFRSAIEEKNEEYGLSRVVSTFDYLHKKDGGTYYVDEDGLNMPWNRTEDKKTWAESPQTIKEVGSIYTVQGFDLNYAGVVIGPSVSYDEHTDRLVIDTAKYQDKGAFTTRKDYTQAQNEQMKEEIILNSLTMLMKRGIHGLFLYAVDPKLKKKLQAVSKGADDERH
ncbi:DUF2075 domain-containing protein [Sinobaca sp. H24]|uniref:DUF2075 domain-containing protein n=1 Tax=Sinobaca sp. H24 TaxID=2923376 RepID=UPI00207A74BD|nr:DUF2075 domain-containing protein [Sinobaca sp. H24]